MQLALTIIDRSLLAVGLLFLSVFAGDIVYQSVSSGQALREFEADRAAATSESPQAPQAFVFDEPVDFRMWSVKRARDYRASLSMGKDAPIAVVRIAKF